VLKPIDVRRKFGPQPDVDRVYRHLVRTMQRQLDRMDGERRLPLVG
jgi:hypothetical protein